MKPLATIELVKTLLPRAPKPGLLRVRRLILTKDRRLIRGAWNRGTRGCVLEHFGRAHPQCRGDDQPGQKFLELCGLTEAQSAFINDWDLCEVTREELLRAIRMELHRRRAPRRREVASCRR